MIIVSAWFLNFFTRRFAHAITLYPFIILKQQQLRQHKVLLNHERIHLRQQLELLIIGFYIWYVAEYLVGRLRGKSHFIAYRGISFEREAYACEEDLKYLQRRKFWGFLKYF
ncbi:MAG: hypothetical protein IPL35_07435 [Sphingobacteriales bacterium]|nr:hypothetical protein [Sphingobacteriales bacterium]